MEKKSKKRKPPVPEMLTPERYDLVGEMEVVSATEQTGLVSSAPVTEREYDNYDEVLHFKPEYGM